MSATPDTQILEEIQRIADEAMAVILRKHARRKPAEPDWDCIRAAVRARHEQERPPGRSDWEHAFARRVKLGVIAAGQAAWHKKN